MREVKAAGNKVLWVGGPAIVHTGAAPAMVEMVNAGYVDVLFAGNALATHDIEAAMYGTSLGVDLAKGLGVEHGHEHHIRAINAVRKAGSIAGAVEQGILKPDGFKPDIVRVFVIEPKPTIFSVQAIIDGWGLPNAAGDQNGFPTMLYESGLIVVFEKEGQFATGMTFTVPQPFQPPTTGAGPAPGTPPASGAPTAAPAPKSTPSPASPRP